MDVLPRGVKLQQVQPYNDFISPPFTFFCCSRKTKASFSCLSTTQSVGIYFFFYRFFSRCVKPGSLPALITSNLRQETDSVSLIFEIDDKMCRFSLLGKFLQNLLCLKPRIERKDCVATKFQNFAFKLRHLFINAACLCCKSQRR